MVCVGGHSWPHGRTAAVAKVTWAALDWGDRSSLLKGPLPIALGLPQ